MGTLFSGSFFIVAMIQPNIKDGEILQMNLQYQFLLIKVFCCFVGKSEPSVSFFFFKRTAKLWGL